MTNGDKEAEIHKSIAKKRRATIAWKNITRIEDEEESSSSSSSMSMYILDSNKEDSYVPSH